MLNGIKELYTKSNYRGYKMKKSYIAIRVSLEKKKDLETELKENHAKLATLSLQFDTVNGHILSAKNDISGYSQCSNMASFPRLLKEAEHKLKAAETHRTNVNYSISEVNKKIITINKDLLEFEPEVTINDVLEHQKIIETEQAELDKLQALIDNQQRKISTASIVNDNIPQMIRKREELLADIAIGNDDSGALSKLDADIEIMRKAQESDQLANINIITDSENTIAGLERRAESIRARITELTNLTPEILNGLIMGMAKQSAKEFCRIDNDLSKNLTELAALDAMIPEFGKRSSSGLFPADWWAAALPNIGGMVPCTLLNGDAGHYINTRNGGIDTNSAIQELKRDIVKLGINL
jgi:hypothetical protein